MVPRDVNLAPVSVAHIYYRQYLLLTFMSTGPVNHLVLQGSPAPKSNIVISYFK
ncbi:MAG: hypothetical protein JWQ01_810 [Massilia sp.]|nr:hypothetical protein [Massilia sp.]